MLGRNTIGFVNTIYIYIKKVNGGPVGFSLFDLIRVGPSRSSRVNTLILWSDYDNESFNTMARLRLLLPYYCGIGLN